MREYVCLFFDGDGIVRATDTVSAANSERAADKARDLLTAMTPLTYVELWLDGKRITRLQKH